MFQDNSSKVLNVFINTFLIFYTQSLHNSIVDICSFLYEKHHLSSMYLSTWIPVCGAIWRIYETFKMSVWRIYETFKMMVLAGGVSLALGLESIEFCFTSSSLSLHPFYRGR